MKAADCLFLTGYFVVRAANGHLLARILIQKRQSKVALCFSYAENAMAEGDGAPVPLGGSFSLDQALQLPMGLLE